MDDPSKECLAETPPSAPSIVEPATGATKEPDESISFSIAASEPPKDGPRKTEVEVWLMAAEVPTILVWNGQAAATGTQVVIDLGDGAYEPGFSELQAWRNYGVRARQRDGGAGCAVGPWSSVQLFRIDDGSNRFFDEWTIGDIELSIPEESYDRMESVAVPDTQPTRRPYEVGTVAFDGIIYGNAGMRVKGGYGSSRHMYEKAALKLKLSDYGADRQCPPTRRARGLKHITLNNQVQDPSFLRERLTYRLYELGNVPVPRRAPIRVHVNDELWGLYLHLETVDRRFVRRRWQGLAAEGVMYEGSQNCELISEDMPHVNGPATCWDLEFNPDCSSPEPGGDPYDYSLLRELTDDIASLSEQGFYSGIRKLIDFDTFLSHWAVDTITEHWDGAIYLVQNNFRIYHNPVSGKWIFLPTGVDQTWQTKPRYPVHPWKPKSILARRCLLDGDCEAAFAARLREVLELFEQADFVSLARKIETQVEDEVAKDPRKEVSMEEFRAAVDETVEFIEDRPGQVRAWLAERGHQD